ncbi:hypothetical protein P389DRAFT_172156 [Cystobasidium minutum MCA 4210]|uniref:uncharacterized protein n=1 Tax=Cystobasidium minutum MCA 4210 TaxID=1397322 RepID=UPI0034CF5897|eukprot:jgi/Rhomi1/172156/fgenesh1_kg.4_\
MSTLYWSPTSPYVKKVVLALRETGLENTVTNKKTTANPTGPQNEQSQWNPSGKVPTLLVDGTRPIFGSQTIVQYIDSIAPSDKKILPPTEDTTRYDELVLESMADSVLDAALLTRYETAVRPEQYQWKDWIEGQTRKMKRAVELLQARTDSSSDLYQLPDPTDTSKALSLGGIAVASALWYLDFRYPEIDWRSGEGAKLAAWYEAIQKRDSWRGGEH